MQRWEIKLNVDIGCKMYSFHISGFTNISEFQISSSLLLQSKIPLMCQFFWLFEKDRDRDCCLVLVRQRPSVTFCQHMHYVYQVLQELFFFHFCTVYTNNEICRLSMSIEIDFWKKIYWRCILCSSREQMEAMVRQYCVCFPASCSTIYINKGLPTDQYSFFLLHYNS